MPNDKPTAAPSADPAPAAPDQPQAAPREAAPSAVPAALGLEHYANLALQDLMGAEKGQPAAESPAGQPAEATPQETSPARAGDDAAPEAAAPEAGETESEPAEDRGEAEPPEEGGEAGEGAYRALQKERANHKETKARLRELRAELDALEQRAKAPPAPESPAPVRPTNVPAVLAECQTPEQVDACVAQSAEAGSTALLLREQLEAGRIEEVRTALQQNGVTEIGNVPMAEVEHEALRGFLTRVQANTTRTLALSGQRRQQLVEAREATHQSMERAVRLLPGLRDRDSAEAREFAELVRAKPQLVTLGPDWPEAAATFLLGRRQRASAPANGKPAKPPPNSPPSAPRIAAGSVTTPTPQQAAAQRIAQGNATMEEIAQYARGHL